MAEALSRAIRSGARRRSLDAGLGVLLVLALASSLGSCLRLNRDRLSVHTPIHQSRLDRLQPGDELTRCLDVLGAPLSVRELGGGQAALVYGWLDQRSWGANVSVPVGDQFSASFDYDRVDSRAEGILLLIDADQRLVALRRGVLRDLLAGLPRPRPAFDPRWTEESSGD